MGDIVKAKQLNANGHPYLTPLKYLIISASPSSIPQSPPGNDCSFHVVGIVALTEERDKEIKPHPD